MFASQSSPFYFPESLKETHELLATLHWQYRRKCSQESALELAISGGVNILSQGVLESLSPEQIDFVQPYNFLHFLFDFDASPLVNYPSAMGDLRVISQVLGDQYIDEVEEFDDVAFEPASEQDNGVLVSAKSEAKIDQEDDKKNEEISEKQNDLLIEIEEEVLCLDQTILVMKAFLEQLFFVLKNKDKASLLNALGQEYEGRSACVMVLENQHIKSLCPDFINQKFPELLRELLADKDPSLNEKKLNLVRGLSGHVGLLHLLCQQANLEILLNYIGTPEHAGVIPRELLAQTLAYETKDHYTPLHFLAERYFDSEVDRKSQAELLETLIQYYYFPHQATDEQAVNLIKQEPVIASASSPAATIAVSNSKSKKSKKSQNTQLISSQLTVSKAESEAKPETAVVPIAVPGEKRAALFLIAAVKLSQSQHDVLALAITKAGNPLLVEQLITQLFQPLLQKTENASGELLKASEMFLAYRDVKGYSYLTLAALLGNSEILNNLINLINLTDPKALSVLCESQTFPQLAAASSSQIGALGVLGGAIRYGLSWVSPESIFNTARTLVPQAFVDVYQGVENLVESTGVAPVVKDIVEVGYNTLSANTAALLPGNVMSNIIGSAPCLPFELGLVSCRREQLLTLADATPFHLLAIRGFCLDKVMIAEGGFLPKFSVANGGLSMTYAALIKSGNLNTLKDIHDMLAPRVALFNLLHYFLTHYDGCEEDNAEKKTARLSERTSRVRCVQSLLASVVNSSPQPAYPAEILNKSERFKHLYGQLELFAGIAFEDHRSVVLEQFQEYLNNTQEDPVQRRLDLGSKIHQSLLESYTKYAKELVTELGEIMPKASLKASYRL